MSATIAQPPGDDTEDLRVLLAQTQRSGTHRRALLLHMDRLPPAMAKPHHQRLARNALVGLAQADRAQSFELSRGRMAIVWRQQSGRELDGAMAALDHLMADLPPGQALAPGQLVSLYDLPDQAAWLLDELVERAPAERPEGGLVAMDAHTLGQLEQSLAQADVAPFVRWRNVVRLGGSGAVTEWEERYVASRDVSAALCPRHRLRGDAWLFRRLTRRFDMRMLALLTGPKALAGAGPLGLHLNVGSILAPEFLRFDAALPGGLRGLVTLYLDAADMLADAGAFVFARNFARSRGYRILLHGVTLGLLALLDIGAADIDYVQVRFCAEMEADPDGLRVMLPKRTQVVVADAGYGSAEVWARDQGFALVRRRPGAAA
jgi:hypothetical protein